jgi:hypothetical protein
MRRVVLSGSLFVALPPEEAIALFTAEGERSWVPHWDPSYPAGGDDREVGTVFVTGDTTWIVIGSTADTMRYARFTPGERTGTVEVRCVAADGGARVEVTYDLTGDDAVVDDFERAYPEMLREWERSVAS